MTVFEFEGYIQGDDELLPFSAQIDQPRKSPAGDFFCKVHVPHLLPTNRDIFGMTESQARQLAIQFLRALLEGRVFYNNNGQRVTTPVL